MRAINPHTGIVKPASLVRASFRFSLFTVTPHTHAAPIIVVRLYRSQSYIFYNPAKQSEKQDESREKERQRERGSRNRRMTRQSNMLHVINFKLFIHERACPVKTKLATTAGTCIKNKTPSNKQQNYNNKIKKKSRQQKPQKNTLAQPAVLFALRACAQLKANRRGRKSRAQ